MSNGVVFNDNKGRVFVKNEIKTPRSSILGRLIEIIAIGSTEKIDLDRVPADIEMKIEYNSLNLYRWVVEEYIGESLLIDESIKELNQTILNGSTRLKQQMKFFYNKALSEYSISTSPFDIEKLKLFSDEVVKEVMQLTSEFVQNSTDLKEGYFQEDMDRGVALITSYSVIECIILENPNDHN
ncbi:MAG: hypothetical protein ACI8RW_000148 [Porticoccaceae bacterium]|jgi:hypothetical protein